MNESPEKIKEEVPLTDEQRKMAAENMKIVPAIARKYLGHGIEFHDLCGDGYLAISLAARSYKGKNDAQFSTYATDYIDKYINDVVKRNDFDKKILASLTLSDLYPGGGLVDEYTEKDFYRRISKLTEEEQYIIKSIMGMGEVKKTKTEIAMEKGVDRHTIGRKFRIAIEKLNTQQY